MIAKEALSSPSRRCWENERGALGSTRPTMDECSTGPSAQPTAQSIVSQTVAGAGTSRAFSGDADIDEVKALKAAIASKHNTHKRRQDYLMWERRKEYVDGGEVELDRRGIDEKDDMKVETDEDDDGILMDVFPSGSPSVTSLMSSLVATKDVEPEEPSGSFSAFLILIVCVTALTGFLMGYDLCIVAVVLSPVRDHFGVCPVADADSALGDAPPCIMNELFVAILAPGAMVSSLVGGWAADRFGRKKVLILSDVFFAAAATMMSLASSYTMMLVGRAFLGVGIGMGFVVFPAYIAEVSPANVRGALVTCQEVAQCIGCLAAYAAAFIVSPNEHWRLLLFCAGIPAILQGLGTLLLPESPRWLVSYKQIRKARVALERIAGMRGAFGGKRKDSDEDKCIEAFIDTLLSSPSGANESDLSRLSRVRATKMLLEEAGEGGRISGLTEAADIEMEIRSVALTLNSRSASRTSFDETHTSPLKIGEEDLDTPLGRGIVAGRQQIEDGDEKPMSKKVPPLKVLLDLMEEQEIRTEVRARKRKEKRRRDIEEFEAAKAEKRLSIFDKMSFFMKRVFSSIGNSNSVNKLATNFCALGVAIGCAFSQNLTGANTILYYSVDLMRLGGICDPVFTGVMIGVVKLIGVLIMLFYLERIGRRLPLIVGTCGTVMCHLGLAAILRYHTFDTCPPLSTMNGAGSAASSGGASHYSEAHSAIPKNPASVGVMLLIWGLMFFWNLSWAGLMFVVASEVLPSHVRGLGMGIAISAFWILAFVVQLGFRPLIQTITASGTFLMFASTSAAVVCFVYFYVPELTGKTLEEISRS